MLSPRTRKLGAALGIAGPVGFISSWVAAGAANEGYSHVSEHISRLAASGAPTHNAVTAGLVGYGLTAPLFARVLGDEISKSTAIAVAASGVATLGIALLPLDISDTIDTLHAVAAFSSYVSLTLVPILASRTLKARGQTKAARVSVAMGLVAGASFAASLIGPAHGLFQRGGITIVDAWLVGAAVAILVRNDPFKRSRLV